jgi:predicted  nucleic acid-binding Zn-ribbon protein
MENRTMTNGQQIEQVVKSIVDTTAERDSLREEVRRLRNDLDKYASRVGFLTEELKAIRAEKEFYQRHSISVHTRLSDISMLINQAMEEAKHKAWDQEKELETP